MCVLPDCRRSIIDVLDLLTSPDRQLAYERNVPHVCVTNELLSMWFDDTYLPGSERFRQSFSKEELVSMEAFNKFFDERWRFLPVAKNGVADWLNDKTWHEITAQACVLLRLLKTRI